MPLDGTGKALGIAATSGPERVANALKLEAPRWAAASRAFFISVFN